MTVLRRRTRWRPTADTVARQESNIAAARARAAVVRLVQRGYSSDAAEALTGQAAWLRDVLRAGGLEPWFQPIVSLPDGRVLGFEALARLRTDDGAIVTPDRFIGVAESSGLILPLGLEILSAAAAALYRWRQEPALAGVYVSVNVSPAQLVDTSFVDSVREVLRAHSLPASALVLEVTESGVAGSNAADTVSAVASTGVRVALDDFGTGFATLENVKRLAVQMLKLDRTFVAGIADGGLDTVIVRNILELAYELDLSVVAEGVETEEQAASLSAWGCDAGQGWLFGRPAPADELLPTVRPAMSAPASIGPTRTGWNPSPRTAAQAIARVLALTDAGSDAQRATVHAVATGLAKTMRLPGPTVSEVGILALCHDAARLQPLLRGEPARLAAPLTALTEEARGNGDQPLVVRLVTIAADATRAAFGDGVTADGNRLAQALLSGAAGQPNAVAQAMRLFARGVPDLLSPPLADLLGDRPGPGSAPFASDDRLRTLVSLSRALSPSTTFRDLVGFLADEVCAIVGAASVSISRWEREHGVLRVIANVGRLGESEERYPSDEIYTMSDYPAASRMFAAGLPVVSRIDDPDLEAAERLLLEQLGKGSGVAVPIYIEDRIWGELYATTEIDEPVVGARDVELLTSVAGVIGGVLARGEHLDRIARLAFEDPLTGLANRRAVDDRLADLIEHTDEIITVVILDANGLKQVNDEYGHAVGDRVLCGVADALESATHGVGGATTARLGGDEFCVILVGSDAYLAAEMITKAAAHLRTAPAPQVTISAGIATSTTTERAARDLFAAADQAQYVAKRSGRLLLVADADGFGAVDTVSRDRRARRGTPIADRVPDDMSAIEVACARVIEALRQLAEAPAPEILETVADILASACDANRWALSRVDDDGVLRMARLQMRRTRPVPRQGGVLLPEDEIYTLDDFPLSSAAVTMSRPFWVHVDRPDHDEAERMVLRDLGMTAVLGIGTCDDRSGWLLELYADEFSEDPGVFLTLAKLVSLTLKESAPPG